MNWTRGAAIIDQLIADGRLERVTATAADGDALLHSAAALDDDAACEG